MVDANQAGANGNTVEAAFHSERVALFTSQVSTSSCPDGPRVPHIE